MQLYLEDPWAEVVRPLKQLIGYAKVFHAAGVSWTLSSHYNDGDEEQESTNIAPKAP